MEKEAAADDDDEDEGKGGRKLSRCESCKADKSNSRCAFPKDGDTDPRCGR